MTTLIITALGVIVVTFLIIVFILAWSSERTRRHVLEREQKQHEEIQKLNKDADTSYEILKRNRAARVGRRVDANDPWRGVRGATPPDGQGELHSPAAPSTESQPGGPQPPPVP